MYGAGAVMGLIAVLLPHGSGVNSAAWAINSALGLPVCAGLLLSGSRCSAWLLHGLLAGAAPVVAFAMVFGGGGPASVATSFFFVWIALYVSWFFSVRATVVHLTADAALFATVLYTEHVAAGPAVWLLVMGTAGVVGAVVTLMHRELVRVATRDPLTGLPTRQVLDHAFAREIARARRTSAPLCVIILDIDGLKLVNDRDGHQAGDRLIADAAHAWRTALRDSDVLVRHGGDEFVALLPNCVNDTGHEVRQRLRDATTIPYSIGLAWWEVGDEPADVLARADAQLYLAKRSRPLQPEPRSIATTSS
jgi:diguanylate cyclase (GGDEF)-like protein